ncbi:MAG: serine hydrolase, partial [Planctomycetales bacterium]|nr:serine hydrolase [Planctomycetales bacterium]
KDFYMRQVHRFHSSVASALLVVTSVFGLARADETQLRERFGEQTFSPEGGFVLRQDRGLPDLVWDNPQLVATVVSHPTIPTRWFNERFEEVDEAAETGRYYAYGEAPAPDGPSLRQAMTCCCVEQDLNLADLAEEIVAASTAAAGPERKREKAELLVRQWQTTEEGAVELAALLAADRPAGPARRGQWQMENATAHVRLKRKLMGLDDKPLMVVTPKQLPAEPAPELRDAPLEETGISEAQVQQIENKLDKWYADSKEPMALVIARNGIVVLAKGYGTLNGEQVTIDTPMSLDSAMKPLMGLQLAMYVDRGIIDLDEPLGNYLPDFDTPRDRKLTFRAGQVHATGIHFPWDLAFRRLFYFHTWHESLIAHCQREWEPGAKYRYGVVGVILSVRALELLRGRNYWDAMERDLFAPLGIHNVLPGGRGFSAENMARIGVLLDNGGKYGRWEVFSEKTHAAILPTSLKPYFPNLDMEYGIGLQNASQHLGPGSYGHGGGCGTLLVVNPKKHLVFAMVRNEPGKNYKNYRDEIMALIRESLTP